MQNHVIIRPDPPHTELMGLDLDIYFEPEKYVSTTGEILFTCEKISGQEWDVDVEVKKGDRVYFRYIHQLGQENHILILGEKVLCVPYTSLICTTDLKPLNGFTLVKHLESDRNFKVGKDENYGIVIADGICKRSYQHYTFKDKPIPFGEVLFQNARPINHYMFAKEPISYVHKKDILWTKLTSDQEKGLLNS